MLLMASFQKNHPISEKATKFKGNKNLNETYENSCSGLAGFNNIHTKNVTTHNPHT